MRLGFQVTGGRAGVKANIYISIYIYIYINKKLFTKDKNKDTNDKMLLFFTILEHVYQLVQNFYLF